MRKALHKSSTKQWTIGATIRTIFSTTLQSSFTFPRILNLHGCRRLSDIREIPPPLQYLVRYLVRRLSCAVESEILLAWAHGSKQRFAVGFTSSMIGAATFVTQKQPVEPVCFLQPRSATRAE